MPVTTAEYNRMIATGVLTKYDRVELLNGQIVAKERISPKHAGCVTRLSACLHRKVSNRAIISVQHPIELDEYSEPEPDLSLLERRADYYAQHHPTPANVLLAIEVIDSTGEKDRNIKLPAYARAGIPEVWLIDLYNDRVEVYTRPAGDLYQEIKIVLRSQRFASTTLPQLKLKADSLLV
jgi:Uma2 family endonuclease